MQSDSRRLRAIALPLIAALLVMAGAAGAGERRLEVVATTGMIADTLREVGGERVSVQSLMGSGTDPHSYRQTRSDVKAMAKADAVFWNGLNLEAQLKSFLFRLASRTPVYAVAEAVPPSRRLRDEEYENQPDPHVWMDPQRWVLVAEAIRDALVELDPDGRSGFHERADAYISELQALHEYATKVLGSVPEPARVLVTAHDAFGYFGDAYQYEVKGIQGFSTESEAGLARIESLVNELVERQIGAVFVETSVSDRNIRALVEGAGARGWDVQIGGELFSDAMGRDGTYEGTYLGMIDHNITTIARSLGGDAPAEGRLGRLTRGVDSQ